jgi:hypothetical protein
MRQHRITVSSLATACACAGLIAAAPSSQAGLVTSCTGTASDVTIPGDLFVPAGESCELTDVTVTGTTTVRADADLILTDSTLNGSLTVQSNGFASLLRTGVAGATRANTGFGVFAADSTLSGNLVATDSGFVFGVGTRFGGGITSTNGQTVLESARLARNLTTTGDDLTDATDTVIGGTVSVTGAILGSVVCTSEIDGAASFAAGGTLQLGGSVPVTPCGFDVFGAGVTVTGNSDAFINGNVIRGDLSCTDNAAAPIGSGNRVRGAATGQCAALGSAAPPAAAVAADPDSRTAGILAAVKARTAGATAAARAAGTAQLN